MLGLSVSTHAADHTTTGPSYSLNVYPILAFLDGQTHVVSANVIVCEMQGMGFVRLPRRRLVYFSHDHLTPLLLESRCGVCMVP